MDRTTLTAALKPLERDGLVAIDIDPEDRRTRLLTLTDAGLEALSSALPIWRNTHAAIEAEQPALNKHGLRVALQALA